MYYELYSTTDGSEYDTICTKRKVLEKINGSQHIYKSSEISGAALTTYIKNKGLCECVGTSILVAI